jgi:hypothetical protein
VPSELPKRLRAEFEKLVVSSGKTYLEIFAHFLELGFYIEPATIRGCRTRLRKRSRILNSLERRPRALGATQLSGGRNG